MNTRIFSYGTLQLDSVQRALFGRLVPMADDVLRGFEAVAIRIEDPDVLEYCGTAVHLALVPAAADVEVPGKVLELEPDDLPAVDQYEGEKYRRVEVPLASGVTAWVYVKA